MNKLPYPPLLLITDRTIACYSLYKTVSAALHGGCRWIMIREKDLSQADLSTLVYDMIEVSQPYNAIVSVNSHVAVAAECGGSAIHLPQGYDVCHARRILGPNALIGVSAHSFVEAHIAATSGADYITLSPIFQTASKPGYGPALGLQELRRVAHAMPIPTIALGGVTCQTLSSCRQAGAAGIAILGTIMQAKDPQATTQQLIHLWEHTQAT